MSRSKVVFSPEAETQLVVLYRYVADKASPNIAQTFTDSILERCESFGDMPLAGVARGDLRPGLRTLSFRRRVVVAYAVSPRNVAILGIYYGGQDYETLLKES